ncbi:MAG: 2-hydroxychromene-2-carboxylate isomerase [Salinarimonas sp.]|nr:2-hydroxychromene-2-carboxylate isomerase [Salinarimonas sp.]
MSRTITYYFTCSSPWTYIGHEPFREVVTRHALKVEHRPMPTPVVFSRTGGLPLGQRPRQRQNYRLLELQRWRDRRGMNFNIQPRHFPVDPGLADRTVIALIAQDADPDRYLRRVFEAVWEEERDIADIATLSALLEEAGHAAEKVLAEAQGSAAEATYALNAESAVAADVFGAPSYVLDGEVFWGQDRIELLDDALSSGRAPYHP